MFPAQVLSADGSCRQAVNDAALKRPVGALPRCSTNTSADGQTRARLPAEMIGALARRTGGVIADAAPSWWRWQGRRVCLVDGATVLLSDTEENQTAYAQPSSQKPGLGFPICRAVALLCLASGALLKTATAPCEGKGNDERTLLRGMLDTLQKGDILLGDAFYPTTFYSASCGVAASTVCSSNTGHAGAVPTSALGGTITRHRATPRRGQRSARPPPPGCWS
jgi:hypothetical protein